MTDSQNLARNPRKILLEDIKLATNNFAKDNFIGQGGFGRVYKGQLKSSSGEPDTDVAVKMLDVKYGQGQHEFGNEILLLASYKHNNIVSLVGFCDEKGEEALVYKHEAHGSLDKHLADKNLTWEQRLRICLGAAHGLEYLHGSEGAEGHRVIHRDMKSSNILLDVNWEAKISDFGLAKLGLSTGQDISCMYTNIVGTHGYADPQYYTTGKLTKKSDVFSFGVVMFEVLCGRPGFVAYHGESGFLYTLVKKHYEAGELDKLIIPDLLKQMNSLSLEKFSKIAFECLNDDRKKRPTMTSVVHELKGALEFQIGQLVHTEMWGDTRGKPYSYLFINNRKLRKIIIRHGELVIHRHADHCIHAITFVVEDHGSSYSSKQYGGDGGTITNFTIDPPHLGKIHIDAKYEISEIILDVDEELIGISGTVGRWEIWDPLNHNRLISSLCFKTKKKNYKVGEPRHIFSEFSESWDEGSLAGFHGHYGYYLDGIGCCLKNSKASI